VNTLRLWPRESSEEFDLEVFNAGDYVRAVEAKNSSEVISKVLYPNDSLRGRPRAAPEAGVLLRRLLHRRHRAAATRRPTPDFDRFADKVAIQLNDTHPAIAIAELMRVLVDEQGALLGRGLGPSPSRSFGYTNHTLLPEALERWPVGSSSACSRGTSRSSTRSTALPARGRMDRAQRQAPRASRACRIDGGGRREAGPHGAPRGRRLALGQRRGQLHSELLKKRTCSGLLRALPRALQQQDQRRHPAPLAALVQPRASPRSSPSALGEGWVTDLDDLLRGLEPLADDPAVPQREHARRQAREQGAPREVIDELTGRRLDPTRSSTCRSSASTSTSASS
jgi:starch phosphorylase